MKNQEEQCLPKDVRRHHRVPYLGPVRISWQETDGNAQFANARCLEMSEGGLLIEVPAPIPVQTDLMLRAERLHLAGAATVKHTRRRGSRFLVGLELSQPLREALEARREREAPSPPAR